MATAVEVRDLKAWFGKTEALHGINMAVESNHATAVIGPSGCGKSTFIRCLNRMHETNPVARAEGEVKDALKKKSGASLSGGQQQRLCIARALAVNPEVMLMDEPCSALDPISTAKIEDLIFELKQKLTIVIVTHNMQQASRVAEFTGFFLMGSLVEFDRTEKIFTNPSDKRTEDYITGRFG